VRRSEHRQQGDTPRGRAEAEKQSPTQGDEKAVPLPDPLGPADVGGADGNWEDGHVRLSRLQRPHVRTGRVLSPLYYREKEREARRRI